MALGLSRSLGGVDHQLLRLGQQGIVAKQGFQDPANVGRNHILNPLRDAFSVRGPRFVGKAFVGPAWLRTMLVRRRSLVEVPLQEPMEIEAVRCRSVYHRFPSFTPFP